MIPQTMKDKLMILSVLPPEHYSKQKIMKLFNCSRYKVDASRKWRKTYGALMPKPIQKVYHKKLDILAAKHFINFLFGTNLLQDVAFSTTTLKYDTGEKQTMPRAILTAMKSHVMKSIRDFAVIYRLHHLCQILLSGKS